MDPASASVAFIGFAASLAALAGLVIESAQTLTALCSKLDHAPDDLKRFLSILKQHEAILVEFRARVTFFADYEFPVELQLLWQQNITQMTADYTSLKAIVDKIEAWFRGGSATKKNIRARVRTFFSTPEMHQLQSHLRENVDQFEIVLTMINEYRLRKQKELLGDISQNVISQSAIQQSKLEKLSSQMSRSEGYLRQQAAQLSGFQHQLRFISAHLRRVPHGFRECRFQSVGHLGFLTTGRSRLSLVRHYWFGSLKVDLIYHMTCEGEHDPSPLPYEAHLIMTYVAPSWLSDMLISVSLASSSPLAMRRFYINRDPRIMNCLVSCDVRGLKMLFDQGLAHPLDIILDDVIYFEDDGKALRGADHAVPRTMMEAFLCWSKRHTPYGGIPIWSPGRSRLESSHIDGGYHLQQSWSTVYNFLDTKLEDRTHDDGIERTLVDLMENQAYERKEVIDIIVQRGVDLAHVLNLKYWCRHTILLILYAAGPRTYVHDFVTRHLSLNNYWAMTPANSWLLRGIVRSDTEFRSKLMAEYRTMRQKADSGPAEREELDFSIRTQLDEMRQSSHEERDIYLSSICAGGTAEDLDLLINNTCTVSELDPLYRNGRHLRHYLEISAALGNRATFFRLIEAGANTITRQDRLWVLLSGIDRMPAFFNNAANASRERSEMMRKILSTISPSLATSLTSTIMTSLHRRGTYRLSMWLNDHSCLKLSRTYERTYFTSASDSFRRDANGAILAAAIVYGDSALVDMALREVNELEWEDPDGLTPLMMAIILRSFESVKKLVALGADTTGVKSCGFSALYLAQTLRKLLERNSEHLDIVESLDRELGGTINRFLKSIPHQDFWYHGIWEEWFWNCTYEDFDKGIRELGLLDINRDSETLKSKDLPVPKAPSELISRPSESATKLLVVFGYLIGVLAHIGYDVWDSLGWFARLPPAAIRILALATLVMIIAFLWKIVLAYWSTSAFRVAYSILVVAITIVVWVRPQMKKWLWRDVPLHDNNTSRPTGLQG